MLSFLKQEPGFYRMTAALAFPIIMQNLITNALGMVDTFMVGVLGERAMAAVTLANVPVFVVTLLIFGVQSGCSVLMSQYWGRGDTGAINRVIGVGCYIAGSICLLFACVMFFFPVPFIGLFSNNDALVELAAEYARIVGFSYVFNGLTEVYISAQRSMGSPAVGMYVLAVSMCANTFLNWVFIFGNLGAPRLEVAGAALATLLSRVLEFAIILIYALRCRHFRLDFSLLLRPGAAILRKYVRSSTPVMLNETMWGLGTAMYTTIMGHMEDSQSILAAYTLAGNIEKVFIVAITGLAASACILIGREIGAGRAGRVYSMGLALNTMAFLTGLAVGAAMITATHLLLRPYLFPLFHLSPQSSEIAVMMITVVSVIMPVRSFNSANIVGVLRGGGDVRAATLIDLLPLWLVSIPLAALMGLVVKWGIFWVYMALVAEQIAKSIGGVRRLRSRQWINDLTRAGIQEETS